MRLRLRTKPHCACIAQLAEAITAVAGVRCPRGGLGWPGGGRDKIKKKAGTELGQAQTETETTTCFNAYLLTSLISYLLTCLLIYLPTCVFAYLLTCFLAFLLSFFPAILLSCFFALSLSNFLLSCCFLAPWFLLPATCCRFEQIYYSCIARK